MNIITLTHVKAAAIAQIGVIFWPETGLRGTHVGAPAQDVEVLRIKNRLDPEAAAHGGAEEAAARATGYRDVGVNLRVTSAAARGRGVDGHVAEVRGSLRRLALGGWPRGLLGADSRISNGSKGLTAVRE